MGKQPLFKHLIVSRGKNMIVARGKMIVARGKNGCVSDYQLIYVCE